MDPCGALYLRPRMQPMNTCPKDTCDLMDFKDFTDFMNSLKFQV